MSDPDKNKRIITIPGKIFPDGRILEQCWDGNKAYFYYWTPEGMRKYEAVDTFISGGETLAPITDELVEMGIIQLPTYPVEYQSEIDLLQAIQSFIHDWVEIDLDMEKLLAGYVMLTWLYDKCPTMPIINARGGAGTGKTRLLETMRQICYRGMRASGCLSFSAMFRTVERWKGTLCINEGDLHNSKETSETVKYLNERYEKGGNVWRTNPDSLKCEFFNAYGPTILTTRAVFGDNALESRCIIVPMLEKKRQDIKINLTQEFYDQAGILRDSLLFFRFKHWMDFENDFSLIFPDLSPRFNQIIQPLASLSKLIDSKSVIADQAPSRSFYKEIEGMVFDLQQRIVEAQADSPDGQIVRAYFDLEVSGENDAKLSFTAQEISSKIEENGGKLSPQSVGKRLVALGFKLKRESSKRPYYLPEDLRETLKKRFIPVNRPLNKPIRDGCDISDGRGGHQERIA